MPIRRPGLVALATTLALLLPSTAAEARPASRARKARTSAAVPDAAAQTVTLINQERAAAGLVPLRAYPAAGAVADRWSRQMARAGRISHNEEYLSPATFGRLGTGLLGENVAVGGSVAQLHRLLMISPPHRRNILDPSFRLVGVAAVPGPSGQIYLTEDFLGDVRPEARPRPAPRRRGS